jgi:trk system potassium uptake protein TrkA
MNAVIVGGGKVGSHLASTLAKEGNHVSLVEVDPDRCEMLHGVMNGVNVICGDGDEPYILEDAGIQNADAVVAATGHDEDNLVVCLLSKLEYTAPLTIARINNPSNAWLFTERFGVDVPVSNTAIMADVLKKVSLGDIVTLLRLNAENMAIDELVLPEDSPAVGKRLADLSLPPCAQIMAIVSKDGVIVPRGDTSLNAGDELLILAQCEDEDALRKAFGVG